MGFLDFLTKRRLEPLADFSSVMVDMHSHLVPGIDDGVKTVEEAVSIVKNLKDLGYKKIITTPHIMSDFYRNTPDIINAGLATVREALLRENIEIEIETAAEYYADYEFMQLLQKEKLLTLGDNYLLFEFSYFQPSDSVEEIVFNIQTSGYKPILAHPERYVYWHNDFEMYKKLKDRGVYFQLNINSLCGHYSPQTKKVAEKMIHNGMIEFLGSDTHNAHHIALLHESLKSLFLPRLIESGVLKNKEL